MKKNYFFFLDEKLYIGISLPREITEQKMSDFLMLDEAIKKDVPPGRISDLIEGQGAILALLEDSDAEYKTGFLPVEKYLEILEGPVFAAIHAALYLYENVDADKEKFIQRTRGLFSFVLGYMEAYAFSDEEIENTLVFNEIFVLLEVLEANHIEVDWSGGLFQDNKILKQYVDTWYPE